MFQGYSQETVDFMWGIRFNNERGWFLVHKDDYQQHLLTPTRELGQAVYEGLSAAAPGAADPEGQPHLPGRPAAPRPGPYKDHLCSASAPGTRTGPAAPPSILRSPRTITAMAWASGPPPPPDDPLSPADRPDPRPLEKLVRAFNRQEVFQLNGPDYVRSKGQVSDLLRPWYQKKSLTLSHEVPLDESLYSPDFASRVTEDLKTLLPFYRYFAALCAAAE